MGLNSNMLETSVRRETESFSTELKHSGPIVMKGKDTSGTEPKNVENKRKKGNLPDLVTELKHVATNLKKLIPPGPSLNVLQTRARKGTDTFGTAPNMMERSVRKKRFLWDRAYTCRKQA